MLKKDKKIISTSTAWYEKRDNLPHLREPKSPFLKKIANQLFKPKAKVVDIIYPETIINDSGDDEDTNIILDSPSITLKYVAISDGEVIKFFRLEWEEAKELSSILNEIFMSNEI